MSLSSFAAFAAELPAGAQAPTAQLTAEAFARHFHAITLDALPTAAHPHWSEVARRLKADPAKPVPAKAIAAIRSWPKDRIDKLIPALRAIAAIIERIEHERQHDEIRASLQRAYL